MNILNSIYRFEIEHVFSEDLFKDPLRKTFLQGLGFEQQATINQVALFSEPRIVGQLQVSSPEARTLFLNAGWGFNRHDRQANPGNFQAGKNDFLREKVDDIRRFQIQDNAAATKAAQKLAVLELFEWTRKLALGEIRSPSGGMVPVMGANDVYSALFDAQKVGVERFADLNDPATQSVRVCEAMASSALSIWTKTNGCLEPACRI